MDMWLINNQKKKVLEGFQEVPGRWKTLLFWCTTEFTFVLVHRSTRYHIPEDWNFPSNKASYISVLITFCKCAINTGIELILNIRASHFASEMSVPLTCEGGTSSWSKNSISIKCPNDRNCNWIWQFSFVIYKFLDHGLRALLKNFWDTAWKNMAIRVSEINFN